MVRTAMVAAMIASGSCTSAALDAPLDAESTPLPMPRPSPTPTPTPDPTTPDPPPQGGIDTSCGDQICQADESDASCPWDCVPYTVEAGPGSQGQACDRVFTGLVPITDIGPGHFVGAAQGGLYPGGTNERPAAHTAAGVGVAESLKPIDGSICMMSVGMSNTGQKWSSFMREVVQQDLADVNPDVALG